MARQTIGDFLAALRKANGYTQLEVADKLGISNKTLSSWEQGRAYPDALTLPALAEIYGVTVDEILKGERAQAGDITGVTAVISEKSQTDLFKRTVARFSVNCTVFIFVIAVGIVLVSVGALLLSYFLGALAAVLGILTLSTGYVLIYVYYKNALTSAGITDESGLTAPQKFLARAVAEKTGRTLVVLGILWGVAAVVHAGFAVILHYSDDIGWVTFCSFVALGIDIVVSAINFSCAAAMYFGARKDNSVTK